MKNNIAATLAALALSFCCVASAATVDMFSPQGEVRGARQVTARFSAQMVPFGDPRMVEPFDIACAAKGRARWADGRNWVYDFDADLSAGVACTFTIKPGTQALNGEAVAAATFTFNTGGPSIMRSLPWEGAPIDEQQVFVLALDAPASDESIAAHARCEIAGINERVGVRVLQGDERKKILALPDTARLRGATAVVQCRRALPNGAEMRLVWGKGIATANGVATGEDRALAFKVRPAFTAQFTCQRVNAQAACIPVTPMALSFSAPIARAAAAKIALHAESGATVRAQLPADKAEWVTDVTFPPPFGERTRYLLELPADLKDDAGRALANASSYPLEVATDEAPPLAKFPARFGIIELNAGAILPVTLRNVEPTVAGRALMPGQSAGQSAAQSAGEGADRSAGESAGQGAGQSAGPSVARSAGLSAGRSAGESAAQSTAQSVGPSMARSAGQSAGQSTGNGAATSDAIPGRVHTTQDDASVIAWLKRLNEGGRPRMVKNAKSGYTQREGEWSLFDASTATQKLAVPKPGGAQAFEVVGIPLQTPGFHVVELDSPRLGAALHGENLPYYVQTGALVTNLAAHFKWGRESSLVWVTTLDQGKPVADAAVAVRDCNGNALWEGRTDAKGIATIATTLPREDAVPRCRHFPGGLFVSARRNGDMTFVLSSWSEGIQPWQFNLQQGGYAGNQIAHTVFDRTLFRAGEAVSMKHFLRRKTMQGFAPPAADELPVKAILQHQGSGQTYELALQWHANGSAESRWEIPKDAKLGTYEVAYETKRKLRTSSGSFRVEAFRVPTMKASIQPPRAPLVNATQAQLDLLVAYLSGGGASYAPVKLRTQVQPRGVSYADYDDFSFGGPEVKEGVSEPRGYGEGGEEDNDEAAAAAPQPGKVTQTLPLHLDQAGAARATIDKLPVASTPQDLVVEMEYQDANGETLSVSSRVPLWPAKINVGIRTDGWAATKNDLRLQVVALDLAGKPAANTDVKVELFQRQYYSHRKRLIGGFYAYEDYTETKRIGAACAGKTDAKGLLVCQVKPGVAGEVIVRASAGDDAGHTALASRSVYVVGQERWWFRLGNNDRMDVIPEKKRYEPGETARFQVRMPFAEATALVTIEREGVIESFVRTLSGKEPVIEVPMQGAHAPNVFVSVLAVRGRVTPPAVPLADLGAGAFGVSTTLGVLARAQMERDIRPKATVDLGKPAFKLGIAGVNVGWAAHELKVNVAADRDTYRVRDKAIIKIAARTVDGKAPPKGAEIALAVVDQGLLELMPNESWQLLAAMMQKRGIEVATSTAQMQVVGKRHFGKKAAPPGGGGGRQAGRELFDTLLAWHGRVALDERGEARVEVPLNDSLTSFRIVAVANAGNGLFGTGDTTIRTTQDVMLVAGVPPLVREGDQYQAGFTVRNASERKLALDVTAQARAEPSGAMPALPAQTIELAPGEAREVHWPVSAPANATALAWEVAAQAKSGEADRLEVKQSVTAAHPVRVMQATLLQLDKPMSMSVDMPADAVPGRGGVSLALRAKLADELTGVRDYMSRYPYTCIEQRVSRAVALRDETLWNNAMNLLPGYLDRDGLAKYFPSDSVEGSDALTAYLIAIADEAGWKIPDSALVRMRQGLAGFVDGRVIRYSKLPTADLAIRKLAAIEALSRHGEAQPKMLDSITLEPDLWPTSAVLDWLGILRRVDSVPKRDERLAQAKTIIRSRLDFQGTTMGFATERDDALWWLMVSTDSNAVRALAAFVDDAAWKEDLPRMVRGALGRQLRGHWNTTTANAWGVVAMQKFSARFEATQVGGATAATLAGTTAKLDWTGAPNGGSLDFAWPQGAAPLNVTHDGRGNPWVTVTSRAAIALDAPLSSGYAIKRTATPIEQKRKGEWSRGDVLRVKLELDAQSDMTWVVVSDPIPAGSAILGSGLGRDSQLLAQGEKRAGYVWPAYEERTFEAFRAYYEYVPKGKWTVEYTLRLNNAGAFDLPATRVEAMYAPEMFGATPNAKMLVQAR